MFMTGKTLRIVVMFTMFSAPPAPLPNSAMMSTLTAHCKWEVETAS